MPIRRELRWLYPIDWPQLSALVRFGRARGRCERCGRPHGRTVHHLGDGRWFDAEAEAWRDGRGREIAPPAYAEYKRLRRTRVVLAAAHLDHDPTKTTGRATCGRSASAATWPTTGRTTGPGRGSPCCCAAPSATCSSGPTGGEHAVRR